MCVGVVIYIKTTVYRICWLGIGLWKKGAFVLMGTLY